MTRRLEVWKGGIVMQCLTKRYSFKGMLIFFCLFSITNISLSQDLFRDFQNSLSSSQAKIFNRLEKETTTIDLRVVAVNREFLKDYNWINLNLFPRKSFMAMTVKLEKRSNYDFTWYGTVPVKVSNIVLSVYKNAVVGFMVIEDEFYHLRSLGEGLNAIVRVDPTKYLSCSTPSNFVNFQNNMNIPKGRVDALLGQNQKLFAKSNSFKSTSASTTLLNGGDTIIKVLVAYTTNAKNAEGGEDAMNALISNSITSANQSFDSSNVSIELQLAHKVEVTDYTESSNRTPAIDMWCDTQWNRLITLNYFQNPTDGIMDYIHNLRDAYAADVAVLITDPSIVVGGEAFDVAVPASKAFCIVRHDRANAPAIRSFAHEIGHLIGGRHQKGTDKTADNCDEPDADAHGYLLSDQQHRTMMHTTTGTRIQYWSNPQVNYNGMATGDPNCCNVARVLNSRKDLVANFRVNHHISGDITLNEDLIIEDGLTLTIDPGSNIKFATGVKLVINGTLVAQGTSSQPILFTRSGTSGQWGGIQFNSGSTGNLNYATIEHVTKGVYVNSTDNVTIDNCTIQNFTEQAG